MTAKYTSEMNTLILISLLKQAGIKNVVASPGTTNMALIGSIQTDNFFTIYSAVDERSAAYIACGIAERTNSPVVLSCTGATASVNYLPGITEAYYRKLPIISVTSMQSVAKVGHNIAQVIDRSTYPKDTYKVSVDLPIVVNADQVWECQSKINRALFFLKHSGGGPVHINLPTTYSRDFTTSVLPKVQYVDMVTRESGILPELPGKLAINIGSMSSFSPKLQEAISAFSTKFDVPIFCDHTSQYRGKNRLLFSLVASQEKIDLTEFRPSVTIQIGDISGDYSMQNILGKEIWRVSDDGRYVDTHQRLAKTFDMKPEYFFDYYTKHHSNTEIPQKRDYFMQCNNILIKLRQQISDIPFSNIWVAHTATGLIQYKANIQLAILNSLRSWNFFEVHEEVMCSSNVGGFGIDGNLSTAFGMSIASPDRLTFCVIGDLAFFYDMNVLGNRHLPKNLRIILINNGKGTEFTQYTHPGHAFGEGADQFISAAGHFGQQSPKLVKYYAESLGIKYFSAKNKDEFRKVQDEFFNNDNVQHPMVFEIFTDSEDESNALLLMRNLIIDGRKARKEKLKSIIGKKNINRAKSLLGKHQI